MELRATRPEDLPGLSQLFERRFGHPLTPEEWRWKYGQIPGEARSRVAVAPDGQVVAHAGALCLPARWAGGEAGVWQLVDFAGTTARRGLRPAFVELGRELLADLPRPSDAPFIFGFPSERHFRLGGRVFGYLPLTDVPLWSGDLARAAQARAGEAAHRAGGDIVRGTAEPSIQKGAASAVSTIESGDLAFEGVEALWESCGVLGVRRSAPFLNWRYYARPGRYYRFYRFRVGAESALAVFGFVGEEARAAELWLPGKEDWLPALRAVAADLQASGLRRWTYWSPVREEWGALLVALGLERTGERQFVGCRGRAGGADPQAAAAGFSYSMGDFDLT